MNLHELVHVIGSFELIQRKIKSLEHILHLMHPSILASHIVFRIQRVSEIEDRLGKLLYFLPVIAIYAGNVELSALELVFVVKSVIQGHLVEELS